MSDLDRWHIVGTNWKVDTWNGRTSVPFSHELRADTPEQMHAAVTALLQEGWRTITIMQADPMPTVAPLIRGCTTCGIGADTRPMGYACGRNDCPWSGGA